MTLEMKPLGNTCNLACTYCYQEPMRNAGNVRASHSYDLDLMMKLADEQGSKTGYTLFGGEALLLPKKDLEILLAASFDKYGTGGLQTNGSLIDDDHIELFKKYNTNVGISIDGPNELNSLRVPASKKKSVDELTEKTMENIRKLAQQNIGIGIIITMHKLNGTPDKLPRLFSFIKWLAELGIKSGNIHLMEVDSVQAQFYSLTADENYETFITLAQFFAENPKLHYKPFSDMLEMQKGNDEPASCVHKSCDPMNTQAVYAIEGNGQLSNCGMVNKEGIEWTKGENPLQLGHLETNLSRDSLLYQTEPKYGGCKGCRFFLMCTGYCPGSAINGDWRNKTVHCKTLKGLFTFYENQLEAEGITPFSKRADRPALEKAYIDFVSKNPNTPSFKRLEDLKPKISIPVKVGD